MNFKYLVFRMIGAMACDDSETLTPPAAGEIVTIEPGGKTVCSCGTP